MQEKEQLTTLAFQTTSPITSQSLSGGVLWNKYKIKRLELKIEQAWSKEIGELFFSFCLERAGHELGILSDFWVNFDLFGKVMNSGQKVKR